MQSRVLYSILGAWIAADRDRSHVTTVSSLLAAILGLRLGVDFIDMHSKCPASQPASITSPLLTYLTKILLRHHRLHIPNHIRILLNASITTKEPHPRHTSNAFANPLILIAIRLIHQLLRLDVGIEVIADKIIVAVVGDAVAQRAEARGVAEGIGFDGVEDAREVRVEGEGAVVVCVAQVFDVFG